MTLDEEWRKGQIYQSTQPWCELRWVDSEGYARHQQMPEELADSILKARQLLQDTRQLLPQGMDVWHEVDHFLGGF